MKIYVALIITILNMNFSYSQEHIGLPNDTVFVNDIMLLQELMGLKDNAYDIRDFMVNRFRAMAQEADSAYWGNLIASIDITNYLKMNAVTFASVFSHNEIKDLIKFYQSPLGRKVISTIEQFNYELADNEGLWAESIRVIVLNKLQEDGLIDFYEISPDGFKPIEENNEIEIK